MKIIVALIYLICFNKTFALNKVYNVSCSYNFDTNFFEIETNKTKNIEYINKKNGIKYKIFIKNIDKFSEIEDYMTQENNLGHKVTYSLKCQK